MFMCKKGENKCVGNESEYAFPSMRLAIFILRMIGEKSPFSSPFFRNISSRSSLFSKRIKNILFCKINQVVKNQNLHVKSEQVTENTALLGINRKESALTLMLCILISPVG